MITRLFLSFVLLFVFCVFQVAGFMALRFDYFQGHFYSLKTSTKMDVTSSNNNHNDNNNSSPSSLVVAAPMYITIGPQCCGKTTIIKQQQGVVDITLDDQPDVYIPVPTKLFIDSNNNISMEEQQLLNQSFQGKTFFERIQSDNIELQCILQRILGCTSPQNFAIQILQHYQEQQQQQQQSNTRNHINNNHTVVAQLLIQNVEQYCASSCSSSEEQYIGGTASPPLPPFTQVFCLESLFQPHPSTNQSAIQRAHQLLRDTPSHIPVAWGNTNSKPRDYQQALEICMEQRRPVHFLMSHPQHSKSVPWVPLTALLQRNLQRFSTTGKYIPAIAIADCCQRIESLIPPNTTNIEAMLVSLASPPPPRYAPRGTPGPFKYVRNGDGLIQKRYPPKQKGPRFNDAYRNRYDDNDRNNNNNHKNNGNYNTNDRNNNDRNNHNNGNYYNGRNNDYQRKRQGPPLQDFSRNNPRPRVWNENESERYPNSQHRQQRYPQQQQQQRYYPSNNNNRTSGGDWAPRSQQREG